MLYGIFVLGMVMLVFYLIGKKQEQFKVNREIVRNGGMSKMFGKLVQILTENHPKSLIRHKTNSVSFAIRDIDGMIHNFKIVIKTESSLIKWEYINPKIKEMPHKASWDLYKLTSKFDNDTMLMAMSIIKEIQIITNREYAVAENQTGVSPYLMVA